MIIYTDGACSQNGKTNSKGGYGVVVCDDNGKLIDARSPLMIMSAGIKYKTELEIICDGENEDLALEDVKSFLENNIG